jgi:glycosyltransferase involved in cell wall biosynthesis
VGNSIEVSVVIPTLNEEITIGYCVEKAMTAFQRLGVSGEVVISDSHSKDRTVAVATGKGARVVYQPLRGYGNAYHKGIAEAQGEIIIIGDADNTYDFSDIEKFIRPIQNNECDMVMGNRLNKTIEKGAMPWAHRFVGTPVMTWILNLLFGTHIKDCNCGMRSFRKDTYYKLNLKSPGWEFASEMVIKAGLLGLKIKDVDITLHKDMAGRIPHLNPWKAAINNFLLMFTFSSRFLFMIPGLILVAAGAVLLVLLSLKAQGTVLRFGPFGINNLAYIASLFMFLSGVQLLWFSLISRIYIYYHRLNHIDARLKQLIVTPYLNIFVGLSISALAFVVGVILGSIVLLAWAQHHFSAAPGFKLFMLSCGLLSFAIQTLFSYFIVNILLDEIRFNLGTEGTSSFRKR